MAGFIRSIPFPTLLSILAMLWFGPVGCGTTGDSDRAADGLADASLPTLREIQPAEMVFQVPEQPEQAPPALDDWHPAESPDDSEAGHASAPSPERPSPTPPLLIQRLVLPRDDYRVELALHFAEQTVLPPPLAERWAANGFYLAELPREKAALLRANLPHPVRVDAMRLTPTPQWQPLKLIGRITGQQNAMLHDLPDPETPPDPAGRTPVRFRGGEHRLLLKLDRAGDGSTGEGPMRLHLLPQHHKVKDSLLPRMPQEKITDGRLFERLQWVAPPPRDRVWLMWADPPPESPLMRPEAQAPEPEDESGTTPPPTEPTDTDGSAEPDPASPAASGDLPTLGQVMFNGRHRKGPVRLVVIIAPQPGAAGEDANAEGEVDP